MGHLNVEIKAKTDYPDRLHDLLMAEGARWVGEDRQIDTYFTVPEGRLKLREGNIENTLVHYVRPDQAESKTSQVALFPVTSEGKALKQVLMNALPVKVVVDKKRNIYFIENVKFHIDSLSQLGTFVEIEAIDRDRNRTETELRKQCERYMQLLGIQKRDLISESYSDLMLKE